MCVPAPKKHVLFSSSRNWLCLSANNWGEDVCTVLGFLFVHLFVNNFDPCCPKKNIQVIVLDIWAKQTQEENKPGGGRASTCKFYVRWESSRTWSRTQRVKVSRQVAWVKEALWYSEGIINRTAAQEDASTTERGELGRIRPEAVTTPGDLKGTGSHCQDYHYMTYIPFKCYSYLSQKKKERKKSKRLGFPCCTGIRWSRAGVSYSCPSVSTLQRFCDHSRLLSHSLLARKSQPWVFWGKFQGSTNWRQGRAYSQPALSLCRKGNVRSLQNPDGSSHHKTGRCCKSNTWMYWVRRYISPLRLPLQNTRLGGLNNRHFLIVMETRSPRSRCWRSWFLVRPLFLACRRSLSHCIFTWPFHHACVGRDSSGVASSSYKDTSLTELGLQPSTSLTLIIPVKSPSPNTVTGD